MQVRVFGQSGESRFPFEKSGPWKNFKSRLEELNYEVVGSEQGGSEAVIANFHSRSILQYMKQNQIPRHRRTLIIWEPWVVDAVRYRSEVLEQYGTVLAPSVIWSERTGAKSFHWPQDKMCDFDAFESWKSREDQVVMIQSNKFSARRGEMYSLRRQVMSKIKAGDAQLIGRDWNKGYSYDLLQWGKSLLASRPNQVSFRSPSGAGHRYSNYMGVVEDKNLALRQFKISLVIENSLDYVSEKLFDSVNAGCVTIYIGPSLDQFGIETAPLWNIPPKKNEILEAISTLIKLNNKDLFELAILQKKQLSKVWNEWENNKVLTELADLAVEDFPNSDS